MLSCREGKRGGQADIGTYTTTSSEGIWQILPCDDMIKHLGPSMSQHDKNTVSRYFMDKRAVTLRPHLHAVLILSLKKHLQRILAARALRALILLLGCQDQFCTGKIVLSAADQ